MAEKIHFTRENGKYISDDYGKEVTTEMVIKHPHKIAGDFGYVVVSEEYFKKWIADEN